MSGRLIVCLIRNST